MSGLFTIFSKKLEEARRREELKRIKRRMIANGDLKIWLDDANRLRLHYKGVELAKSYGLSSSILSEGIWYHSRETVFDVEKVSENQMRIFVSFPDMPIRQEWLIKIDSRESISCEINTELTDSLRIDRVKVDFLISKSYSRLVYQLEDAVFPQEFNALWNISGSLFKDNFIGCVSLKPEYPSICLRSTSGVNNLFGAGNTDSTLSSRVLEAQVEETDEYLKPGTYEHFKIHIQLYPDKTVLENILSKIRTQKQLEEEEARRKQEELKKKQLEEETRIRMQQAEENRKLRSLQQGDFRIFFDQENCFHLFYKDNEITKANGLNTGIFSEGKWHTLLDSKVEIERPSASEILIYFNHNYLPLVHIWHCKINAQGILELYTKTDIKNSMRIDRRNISLMASKKYTGWFASGKEGDFPRTFFDKWQGMNNYEDHPEFIALLSSSEGLPGVIFKDLNEPRANLLVQNTDSTLSSRVLEAQVEETDEYLKPGTYEHFKIHIQLYPDKTVLENILSKIRTQKQLEEEEARRKQEELKKKQLEEETEKKILEYFKEYPADPFPGKEGRVHLYGDSDKLHDKISGVPGDFIKIIGKIKKITGKGILYIGVSRYNFFRLHTIAQYAATLMGQRIDLRSLGVTFLPVRNLYANFGIYLNELNQHLSQHRIHLYLKDAGLLELLHTMSSQADQYNERDLLRLLGVIAEHPFIGPQTIVLDTYHRCNTDCLHCWIHTPKRKIIGRIENLEMDINLYKQIIDDAERVLCDEIIIQGDGEPMLDNRFMELIAYARNKGLKTLFFTNGILLDKKKAAGIVDLEVNEIFCSLPAGTAKTYALINSKQSENTFSVIENNLKNLINMRNNAGRSKPLLQMTHVIHNLNYHEMEEMARLDASIGADKVRFYLVRLDNNIKFLKLKASHIRSMQESLQRIEPLLKAKGIELQDNIHFQLQHYNPENGDWSGETFSNMGCPVGWFFSLALFRGEVSMCCHLRIIDILKEKSFTQIWNSDRYNEVRIYAKYLNKHKNEHLLNGKKLFDDSCRHCDTHQVILRINQLMNKYHLDKFYQESFL